MYKSFIGLRLSSLFLLSQLIDISFQFEQCLVTLKNVRVERDYSFSLAQVQDLDDPLGPQEACYYSCGGQIVTQSPDIGDMTQLTLLDKSASFLTSTGFLRMGHVYFVNLLGFGDEDGGNGIGCVEIENTKKFNHYPLSHSICKHAHNAICGFWGKQTIPLGPMNRNGTEIEHPNASEIEITKSELPVATPKPKTAPGTHEGGWGWRGGSGGGVGGWNGQHHWEEAEDGQFNLAGTVHDKAAVDGVAHILTLSAPVLIDSVVTLPIVKYERDPGSGKLVEVTKYASFVQLDDYKSTQNGQYKTDPGIFAQPTGNPEKSYENLESADEDYEFGAPVPTEINYINPLDTVDYVKKVGEEHVYSLPQDKLPHREYPVDNISVNITPFSDNPVNDFPGNVETYREHDAPVSIVDLTTQETIAESEIINFEAFDDLNEIIGGDPVTKDSNDSVDSILLEEISTTEIVSLASTIVEDEVRQIPVMAIDLNNTVSDNIEFNVMGKTFRVVPHFNTVEKTMEQVRALCIENDALISAIESTDYSDLTSKLAQTKLDNVAIGSWNGNDYLLTGPNCLIIQVGLGVFPSECSSASAVMCQI